MEMKVHPGRRDEEAGKVRSVTVLGSTGSIGCNTLDLIGRAPERFRVEALTGNANVELLIEQAKQFRPRLAVIGDAAKHARLKEGLAGTGIETAGGTEALLEAAARPAEFVMAGIVGIAGLAPTLTAARRGAIVGLANKECLVCAGDFLTKEIERGGAELLPVDSEHNAIFQCFDFHADKTVERLILTASGGPFRERSLAEMETMTPAQAVAHPNWDMGAKISVDSATMMNKGLELIEAYYLFPVDEPQIEIIVHPQSVVHSLVGYVDGSVLAQMGPPDMRTPISFALAWPNRMATPSERLDLAQIRNLTFEAPDLTRFPALRIARSALRAGGAAPIVLNAANEVAVRHFLDGAIGFLDIARLVESVLDRSNQPAPSRIEDVSEIDLTARRLAGQLVGEILQRRQ
jgi:1-deoxy-D-xylulose-5-phosphate reductoisomerase